MIDLPLQDYVLGYLKRSGETPGHYELVEPHLLYLNHNQSVSYLQAMQNTNYSDGFHTDLKTIMQDHAAPLASSLHDPVLIDLGPGYPDKTLPIMQAIQQRGKKLHYLPVDISQNYLDIASQAARPYAFAIHPMKALFTECEYAVKSYITHEAAHSDIVIFIGLTFMNFPADQIIALLHSLSPRPGLVMLASEMITAENPIEKIMQQYSSQDVQNFTFGPLAHLGFQQDMCQPTLTFNTQLSRIELGFIVPTGLIPSTPDATHIITAVSYRYDPNAMEIIIRENFPHYQLIYPHDSHDTVLAIGQDTMPRDVV